MARQGFDQTRKEIKEMMAKQRPANFKEITFEEYYGKEQCDQIRNKIEELFKSKGGGFLIFCNMDTEYIGDAYMAVCGDHVKEHCTAMVDDAVKVGLIPAHGKEHKHR